MSPTRPLGVCPLADDLRSLCLRLCLHDYYYHIRPFARPIFTHSTDAIGVPGTSPHFVVVT